MMVKVAHVAVCAIPALLLAAGITHESGDIEDGVLVMMAFVFGRLSK